MLKIWWFWKIEIWSEELVDGYQTVPYQPGDLIWGGQLCFQRMLILTIPCKNTSNFTPGHVYPRLKATFTRVRTNICTDKYLQGSTVPLHGTGRTGRIFWTAKCASLGKAGPKCLLGRDGGIEWKIGGGMRDLKSLFWTLCNYSMSRGPALYEHEMIESQRFLRKKRVTGTRLSSTSRC